MRGKETDFELVIPSKCRLVSPSSFSCISLFFPDVPFLISIFRISSCISSSFFPASSSSRYSPFFLPCLFFLSSLLYSFASSLLVRVISLLSFSVLSPFITLSFFLFLFHSSLSLSFLLELFSHFPSSSFRIPFNFSYSFLHHLIFSSFFASSSFVTSFLL